MARQAQLVVGAALRCCGAFVAALGALGACHRAEPLASCKGSLAGLWEVEPAAGLSLPEPERWAILDRGVRVELYPLFDDAIGGRVPERVGDSGQGGETQQPQLQPPAITQSPRSLSLIRSNTSLLGHVERWALIGATRCQLRASARIAACKSDGDRDVIEVQLGELPPVTAASGCPTTSSSRLPAPQRWRRLR